MNVESEIRSFKIWEYAVSHRQLLIRSYEQEKDFSSNNVDFIFTGVSSIYVSDFSKRISLDMSLITKESFDASDGDLDQVRNLAGLGDDTDKRGLFVLRSAEVVWYIRAGHWRIDRNNLESMESNLDTHVIRRDALEIRRAASS